MHFRSVNLLFLSLLTLVFSFANAQQFGGNPASIKWKQIKTDTLRVIFPAGLDSTANRAASVMHELQKKHANSIGSTLRKVNVVLQNQTTLSNAYVTLAPYRSEFYLIAPQNSFELGTLPWADNLALHEYRHVQQFSNFRVGLSKVLSYILGEEGQAIGNAFSIPDWFFEGDAVFSETALSTNGRGRLPNFFNPYKSLLLANKNYKYMKLRNGSLRDFVPNHYDLGYLLVAYGREKYGSEFWKKVTHDAASFAEPIYPLQSAVKKYAGISYKQFVQDAFSFYNNQWQQPIPSLQTITIPVKNNVTYYNYPYTSAEGNIIVLKKSYQKIPTLIRINRDGKEEKIAVRDIAYDDYFSYNNGRIVYASLKPNARWGFKEYSNIKLVDEINGKEQTITHNTRYFSPDISHDGNLIAAVKIGTDQSSAVVILDRQGIPRQSFTEAGHVYTYPKFSKDDKAIFTAVRNSKGLMALQKISIADKSAGATTLLPFGNRVIGLPVVQGDTVFFTSSYKGSDEVWAYIESNYTTYRIATSPTGLYQATYNAKTKQLVTSIFTAEGTMLVAIPPSLQLWQRVNLSENATPDLYVAEALKQESNKTLQDIPFRKFAIGNYKKTTRIFNFHSWRPYYDDPDYSFSLYGENVLNTFRSQLSYTYNRNEKSHAVSGQVVYGGWYVQPLAGITQRWQRQIRYNADTSFFYNELTAYAGLQLPLNFTGGKQFRSLLLSTLLNTETVNWRGLGKRLLADQQFNYLQSRIVFSSQIQKAVQQINPRWAQTVSLQYRTIIKKYTANQFLANGSIFLPALHSNHSIVLNVAYHARDTMNQYAFSNSFPFSRGYAAIDFPRMWKIGFNYHLPLLYPDFGFGNMVYLKRLRANVFYDFTKTKSVRTGIKSNFRSAGGEVYFDTKWWNQQDVSFGIRYSRLQDNEFRGRTQPNQWEFIVPLNLLSH